MRITLEEYTAFVRKYYEVQPRAERYGQFFCNVYNITDSVLFYSTDHEFIVGHIMDNYIDFEEVPYEHTDEPDETGPYGHGR
jgi:hypothetical protein